MKYIGIISGVAAGVLVYLAFSGVQIAPFLFFAGMLGILFYFNGNRLIKNSGYSSSEAKVQAISFDDIGGQDVAKNELCEALEFIKNSEKIQSLGIRPLKGILLNGPPGTGKTLLAKAAAQLTNSVFLSASGSEFVEMYVGVGAKRVRQLFSQARQTAKKLGKNSAVIFIDEMEILGGTRGANHGHQEHDQTLNELLVQMDGINSNDEVRVLVIGATNRADMLDSALLRPGRFDRLVKVDLPDRKGRAQILELHTRNKPLADDVSIDAIAGDTFGFSGAHIESVANEAAIMAMRDGSEKITSEHFRFAIEKVMMGEKLDRMPTIEEKTRISVHEAGHALVGEAKFVNSVASVNVASRSNALGYVRQTQEDDIYLYTHDYLKGKISVALAGAVSEEIMLGNRSTGCSNDYKHAAEMAKHIVFSGMSELGVVSAEDIPKEQLHTAVSGILNQLEEDTRDLILQHEDDLRKIVSHLQEKETISGDELRAILHN